MRLALDHGEHLPVDQSVYVKLPLCEYMVFVLRTELRQSWQRGGQSEPFSDEQGKKRPVR